MAVALLAALAGAAAHANDDLIVVTDSRHPVQSASGARVIELDLPERIEAELAASVAELKAGVLDGRFAPQAAPLFRIRIKLAGLVRAAADLELDATGGRAYLVATTGGFARRWVEAAFVPVVTPSLTQLHGELARHAALRAA